MNMLHKEIVDVLKQIPKLQKEYIWLEKSIAGTEHLKKKLSKEDYQIQILNFDNRNHKGIGLLKKIYRIGKRLNAAQPDFTLSISSKIKVDKYLSTVGTISDRMKKQLDLFELVEAKKKFEKITDFLDNDKIKELNKYLKGRK